MRRRTNTWLAVLLMSGWLGVSGLGVQAPQTAAEQPNVSTEKGKEGNAAAVALLNQAGELVRYARDNESPLAMLTAVQMLERVRMQDGSQRVGGKKTGLQQQGEQVKEGHKGATPEPTLDPQKLLAEARPWAKGHQQLVALIDAQAAKAKPAAGGTLGAVSGAIYHIDSVSARSYDDYTIAFRAGEVARIAVIGDGDTDVDLIVYDENGHEIGRDDDGTSNCVVQFTPRWTGQFRVRVINNGYVYSRYLLVTN
jgi:hypothetical protein